MRLKSAWLMVAALLALGGALVFGQSTDEARRDVAREPAPSRPQRAASAPARSAQTARATAAAAPETASGSVAHRVEPAPGGDVEARAIDALAFAPRSAAIPVLQKLLNGGTDADRQQALNALHTLALRQGDADGAIRDVLRLSIYDGDDVLAEGTRSVLEEIERDAGE